MGLACRCREIVLAHCPTDHVADTDDLIHRPVQVDLTFDIGGAKHIQAGTGQLSDEAGVPDDQRDGRGGADVDLLAIPQLQFQWHGEFFQGR